MERALLVIDAQKIYTNPQSEMYCEDSAQTINNINLLIEGFEKHNYPIIYVRHVHKTDGSDLGRMFDFAGPTEDFNFKDGSEEVEFDGKLKISKSAVNIFKKRYSSFVGTKLEQMLKHNKISTVVICGFMTNFCCESTAREAHDKDYYVDFIKDATGAPALSSMDESEIRRTVSEFLAAGFAVIYDTESYLATL